MPYLCLTHFSENWNSYCLYGGIKVLLGRKNERNADVREAWLQRSAAVFFFHATEHESPCFSHDFYLYVLCQWSLYSSNLRDGCVLLRTNMILMHRYGFLCNVSVNHIVEKLHLSIEIYTILHHGGWTKYVSGRKWKRFHPEYVLQWMEGGYLW